jgi:hypothetical protein
VVFGNLVLLCWALLASSSFTFINQLYAWLLFLFTAATVFLILRRQGCSSCYNCNSCISGFGRLAGWFFGSRQYKDINNKTALVLVGIIYILLVVVPIWVLAISIVQGGEFPQVVILVGLLVLTAYSASTWFKLPGQAQPATPSS